MSSLHATLLSGGRKPILPKRCISSLAFVASILVLGSVWSGPPSQLRAQMGLFNQMRGAATTFERPAQSGKWASGDGFLTGEAVECRDYDGDVWFSGDVTGWQDAHHDSQAAVLVQPRGWNSTYPWMQVRYGDVVPGLAQRMNISTANKQSHEAKLLEAKKAAATVFLDLEVLQREPLVFAVSQLFEISCTLCQSKSCGGTFSHRRSQWTNKIPYTDGCVGHFDFQYGLPFLCCNS